jgi:hypothetical protein
MVVTWSILAVLCLIGYGLSLVRKHRIRHFDPNLEDRDERIAKARSRALTRAEFEKAQQAERESEGGA